MEVVVFVLRNGLVSLVIAYSKRKPRIFHIVALSLEKCTITTSAVPITQRNAIKAFINQKVIRMFQLLNAIHFCFAITDNGNIKSLSSKPCATLPFRSLLF